MEWLDRANSDWEASSEVSSTEEQSEEEKFPQGRTYPLNSKRIASGQLQALAKVLELPTGASNEETRQLLEGKLMELEREPRNVQVVVREDKRIFLVYEEGIIVSTEHVSNDTQGHVSSEVLDHVNNESHRDDVFELRSALCEAHSKNESLTSQLFETEMTVTQLQAEVIELKAIVTKLEGELKKGDKAKRFWRQQCEQLALHEASLEQKDAEIARLKEEVVKLESPNRRSHGGESQATRVGMTYKSQTEPSDRGMSEPRSNDETLSSTPATHSRDSPARMHSRRGKAPPLDCFSGENPEITFEDWLPSLERVARWNEWPEEDTLLQLAGHLRGRALQEWLLLTQESKNTLQIATAALTAKLETRSKVLAAQDFRHI